MKNISKIMLILLMGFSISGCSESKEEKARKACMKQIIKNSGSFKNDYVDNIRLETCTKRTAKFM